MSFLVETLVLAILIQIIFFIPAYFFKSDKFTDFSYALTFIILSFAAFFSSPITLGKTILFIMILFWAFRLGSYLVIRIRKIGKDARFDGVREDFWHFLQFWLLQGVSVWIILTPFFLYIGSAGIWQTTSIVGLIVWLAGFTIESIADHQKFTFKNDVRNKNKWIDSGLWSYSRHPNYFGEFLCWLGAYLFTLPMLGLTHIILGIISPLYILTLLLFFTGVPQLEQEADRKWGNDKKYQEYKKSTSMFVLMPRK